MLDATIPPLPLPGHEDAVAGSRSPATSIDEFIQTYPNIIAREERRAVMERAGFVAGATLDFSHGQDRYSMSALVFESPEGAREHYEVHLHRVCRDALALQPMFSGDGGVVSRRSTSGGPGMPRAIALVGNVEISVTVCACTSLGELELIAGKWVSLIAAHLTTPDAPVCRGVQRPAATFPPLRFMSADRPDSNHSRPESMIATSPTEARMLACRSVPSNDKLVRLFLLWHV